MLRDKILTRDELAKALEGQRDKTIVSTNGCYDLMHPGHLYTFMKAKNMGDILVVGVNTDEYIRKFKNPFRPILQEGARAMMVASCMYVDYVVLFGEENPIELLKVIKPNIHLKSKTGYKGLEKDVVESNGGQIVLVDDLQEYSTTNLIHRCVKSYIQEERGNTE